MTKSMLLKGFGGDIVDIHIINHVEYGFTSFNEVERFIEKNHVEVIINKSNNI